MPVVAVSVVVAVAVAVADGARDEAREDSRRPRMSSKRSMYDKDDVDENSTLTGAARAALGWSSVWISDEADGATTAAAGCHVRGAGATGFSG